MIAKEKKQAIIKEYGRKNYRTHRIDRFNGLSDSSFQFPGNA